MPDEIVEETPIETPEETPAEETSEESPFTALRNSLTDEKVKSNAERFNSFEDLAKGHLELRQKLSKGGHKPGEGATEDDIRAFRKEWNIPDSPDKYDFGLPEDAELTDIQKASFEKWGKVFHDNNIGMDVSKAIVASFQEDIKAEEEAQAEARAEFVKQAEEDLKADWGKDYDANLKFANHGAVEMFGEDFEAAKEMQTSDGKMLLDHPAIIRAFAKVGREMGESGLGDTMNDAEKSDVREQIEETIRKRDEAQAAGRHKEAQRLSDKEQSLYTKLHGSRDIVGTRGRRL